VSERETQIALKSGYDKEDLSEGWCPYEKRLHKSGKET
jgi:hypothetical protein